MKKIGITGNIAAGKSLVEDFIKNSGYKVIDADAICHVALENNPKIIKSIQTLFKNHDILEDGQLCRKKIGKIVFSNHKYKKELEKILHPFVREEIERFFEANKSEELVFVSAALLFEANLQDIFDKIIFVSASDEMRLERLKKRNNLTTAEAKMRLNAQKPQDEKIKLADFVLENNFSTDVLKKKTFDILKLLH